MSNPAMRGIESYQGQWGRRYQISVQPDLFGGFTVTRVWFSSNSRRGGSKTVALSTPEECDSLLHYLRVRRRQRGYVLEGNGRVWGKI